MIPRERSKAHEGTQKMAQALKDNGVDFVFIRDQEWGHMLDLWGAETGSLGELPPCDAAHPCVGSKGS